MRLVYEDTLLVKTSNNTNEGKPSSILMIMSQQLGHLTHPVYPFICKLDSAWIYSEGVLRVYILRLKFIIIIIFFCFRII